VVPDTITVSVTVPIDSLRAVEVGVIGSVDVAVPALNVEDADEGLVESPGSDPVIPPVAPAAAIIERALFSLVQAIIVPFEVIDGSAKHCWVAGQLTCDVSNCPFTQEAMAPWIHVVSPSVQGPVVLFANWALSVWASRALLSRVAVVPVGSSGAE
jgi:hypothetical protein